uniref:F-box domain-containing protein n=1 Tax=Fagus sylvatica TaxID=28930 RepID=A0A2N9G7W2_FAGSY
MSDNVKVSYDSLPDEIVTQILIRLPIKSIITCTSVCKAWKSLIQNPTFISTHLHHSINNNNNHYLFFRFYDVEEDIKEKYPLYNDNDFILHTRFDFPLEPQNKDDPIFHVVGTCNGLVCLSDDLYIYTNEFFLWNPCVRKFVKLPYPNLTYHPDWLFRASIGFGFDAETNDYKVVRMVSLVVDHNDDLDIEIDRPEVEVFSVATGEWRKLRAYVSVYGNSIALFQRRDSDYSEYEIIWVMKEYSVASSWTKVLTIDDQDQGWAIGSRRNGEVVFESYEWQLFSLDLETREKKDLRISSYTHTFVDSYDESLILLDKAANGAVTY